MTTLTLRLSAFDRDGFDVNLEPEGAEHRLPRGTVVTIDFPRGTSDIEVSWHPDGLSVMRDGNVREYPAVHATGVGTLDW